MFPLKYNDSILKNIPFEEYALAADPIYADGYGVYMYLSAYPNELGEYFQNYAKVHDVYIGIETYFSSLKLQPQSSTLTLVIVKDEGHYY